MAEISNKTLAVLVVLAIIISLWGVLLMGKGPAVGRTTTAEGRANISVTNTTAISLVANNINFGTGRVNGSYDYCEINTSTDEIDSTACIGFQAPADGFVVRNDGNNNVNLTLASNKAASGFLGGTSPEFNYKTADYTGESGSCVNGDGLVAAYTALDTTTQIACTNMTYDNSTDEVEVLLQLRVPSDVVPGDKEANITFTGTYVYG